MYKVEIASRRVERQIDNLPWDVQDRVLEAIAGLAKAPRPPGVRKLKDDLYRIRVGAYRVIYWLDDTERLIVITRVARRDERTYRHL